MVPTSSDQILVTFDLDNYFCIITVITGGIRKGFQ